MANKDNPQPSVTLGLVAAKIALAELEGDPNRHLSTAHQAFAAMRNRLNELIKEDRARRSIT